MRIKSQRVLYELFVVVVLISNTLTAWITRSGPTNSTHFGAFLINEGVVWIVTPRWWPAGICATVFVCILATICTITPIIAIRTITWTRLRNLCATVFTFNVALAALIRRFTLGTQVIHAKAFFTFCAFGSRFVWFFSLPISRRTVVASDQPGVWIAAIIACSF